MELSHVTVECTFIFQNSILPITQIKLISNYRGEVFHFFQELANLAVSYNYKSKAVRCSKQKCVLPKALLTINNHYRVPCLPDLV